MAKLKISNSTIQAKLQKWAQGQEIQDELIFFENEVNQREWQQKAWDIANLRIEFSPDTVNGFTKIVYVDKL